MTPTTSLVSCAGKGVGQPSQRNDEGAICLGGAAMDFGGGGGGGGKTSFDDINIRKKCPLSSAPSAGPWCYVIG